MWTLPKFEWPQQKQKCLTCTHYQALPKDASTVMLCKIGIHKGFRGIGTCIDERTRGKCGKDAKLWEAKMLDT
jgi:hypothetical protein